MVDISGGVADGRWWLTAIGGWRRWVVGGGGWLAAAHYDDCNEFMVYLELTQTRVILNT
ncbi:hypothetical protein KFK09_022572 [Dendrobium nobile]|uniref:Uncharacterized protein n=1 Tax=Dendrobium nobile TaxID=94219 RepID=A0A8T3AJI2_DENNO|nr:hypothetical protein KFK09_022572 [Dendrobium nobile]